MSTEHRLEKRSEMLASRMRAYTDALAKQLGEGDRPPFTEALTRTESLTWWRAHRDDDFGRAVLERMRPLDVARLDVELARFVEGDQTGLSSGAPPEVA
jgi:hypothetical protein